MLAALVALAAAVFLLLRAALLHTGGHLVYALDDAYIHMAVARSLARDGVWGVTPYAFTSSTSSLAWPLLLAGSDLLAGVREATPLVLNVVFAAVAIVLADRLLAGVPVLLRVAALLAVVFLTPLPTLVLAGMEHTLQIAAVFWLLDRVRAAEEDGLETRPTLTSLGAAAALATAARYESLFLIAPAAVTAVAAAVLPLAAYGAVSMAHGWPPLPNSLLLKRATFEGSGAAAIFDRLGGHALRALGEAPHLLVLLAAVILLSARRPAPAFVRAWDAIFVTGTLLHLQLAALGWLFRYEAYLVAIGVVLVARHLAAARAAPAPFGTAARAALAVAALVAAAPLAIRAVQAADQAPRAVKNIYEQQYQMGLFLHGLPAGSTVMANDIGAVAWLADVRLIDLYGLATQETARARREGRVDRALLAKLAAPVPPAAVVVYRSWFASAIPPDWIQVGTWRVPEEVVVADRTVTFYATRPAEAALLARALAAFESRLPAAVIPRLADVPSP